MKTTLIFAMFFGITAMFYDSDEQSYQSEEYRPNKAIILNPDEMTFHDDFDSTYYVYGCKYNSFKSNHKCNEKN
jgi:hypothetical protein